MTDSELQQKRLIAAAIDVAVAVGIMVVFWVGAWIFALVAGSATGSGVLPYLGRVLAFVGSLISLGYILGRDVVMSGNSIGKKTQGIRVVTSSGAPITFVDSAKRNAFFAIGSALGLVSATLGLIPCLGDAVNCLLLPLKLLGLVVALVVVVVEIVKITQEPEGVRLGDNFAGTRVVR